MSNPPGLKPTTGMRWDVILRRGPRGSGGTCVGDSRWPFPGRSLTRSVYGTATPLTFRKAIENVGTR